MSQPVDEHEQPRSEARCAIGDVLQTRSHVQALVRLPRAADHCARWRLLGGLRYYHLVFTEPTRGSAAIVSTYFSNEGPE